MPNSKLGYYGLLALLLGIGLAALALAVAGLENILFPTQFAAIATPFYMVAFVVLFFAFRGVLSVKKRYVQQGAKMRGPLGFIGLIALGLGIYMCIPLIPAAMQSVWTSVALLPFLCFALGGALCLVASLSTKK